MNNIDIAKALIAVTEQETAEGKYANWKARPKPPLGEIRKLPGIPDDARARRYLYDTALSAISSLIRNLNGDSTSCPTCHRLVCASSRDFIALRRLESITRKLTDLREEQAK